MPSHCLKNGHASLSAIDDLEIFYLDLKVTFLQSVVCKFVTGKSDSIVVEVEVALFTAF